MEQTYLTIFVTIVIVGFVADQVLDYLNNYNRPELVPKELEGIYNQEKYAQSLHYQRDQNRVANISSWISFVIILGLLLTQSFGTINRDLENMGLHGKWLSLAFFGLIFLAGDLLSLPLSLYATFVVEEKYGFNKTTLKTFFADKLKSYALTVFLGGGLLYLLLSIIISLGNTFWIWAWLLMVAVMVFMNFFYTTLFVPLFNKLTPLADGELKEAIVALSEKLDFPLKKIMVMDASKRSSKSNAYFSGFGKLKSIVLFDTLLDKHSNKELLGILAHEIGHYKKRHIVSNLLIAVVLNGLTLYVLSWFIFNDELSKALGAHQLYYHLNIIAFGILFEPISTLTGLLGNVLSRKHEYEADAFAVKHTDKEAFKDALKTLSTENLSDLQPHPAYVFVHYSHPTVLQRLKAIDDL
ncbi:M48 family metalloprotease [bacterium]|nr:M48 family metalloprotease [bacterium]